MYFQLIKVYRYFVLYGLRRTIIKIAGRKNIIFLKIFFPELLFKKVKDISLIGCGQFGFSTITFFLLKNKGNRFLDCYDPNDFNSTRTEMFWGYHKCNSYQDILKNENCKIIYIASNHNTHTSYAISALQAGKIVYVEKPISVSYEQLTDLLLILRNENYFHNFYVGYNRPFSKAILEIKKNILNKNLPLTFTAVVAGHYLELDHWYRNPEEGTRICGNVGHWVDLAIHLIYARGYIPNQFNIVINYSNQSDFDDNLSISITTEFGDLISIVLTSRLEPFEGIDETIVVQTSDFYAKIDDFRKMTIWRGATKSKYNYNPKDVGHLNALNQPFVKNSRNFNEIEISTILILEITDMVKKRECSRTINPFSILSKIIS